MGPGPCASSLIPCARPLISVSLSSGLGHSNRLRTRTFFQTDRDTKKYHRARTGSDPGPNAGWLGPVPGLVRVRAESWFGPGPGSRGAPPSPSRFLPGLPSSTSILGPQPSYNAIHHTYPSTHSFCNPTIHSALLSFRSFILQVH
jgi:hypothetical protein